LDCEKSRIKLEGILQEKEEEYARTQEQLNDFKMFVNGNTGNTSNANSRGQGSRRNRQQQQGFASDNMLDGDNGNDPFDDDEDNNGGNGGTGNTGNRRNVGRMSDSHSRDLARRLLSLSEEVKASKLRLLRQDRELKLLRDDKRNLVHQTKRDDETQRKLEEDLVAAQTQLREKELQALRETDMGGQYGTRFKRDDQQDDAGEDDEFNGSTLGMSLMLETMPGQKKQEADTHVHCLLGQKKKTTPTLITTTTTTTTTTTIATTILMYVI